jgi:CheY-like chemotaxis protein
MNILVLESDPAEQKHISKLIKDEEVSVRYESSIPRAINSLGIRHTDLALVDADCKGKICSWSDLVDLLKKFNIEYAVFSSNGKVGEQNGQAVVALDDIPKVISSQHAV